MLDLPVEVPKILGIDDILQFRHFIAEFLHLLIIGHFTEHVGDFIESIEHFATRRNGLFDIPLDVFVGIELWLLR